MRYGIFSDVHANLEALEAVMRAFKVEAIDRYLCVGDIVGYAANPCECLEKILELQAIVIAGNHDWGAVDLLPLDYFNPLAAEAILWTKTKLGPRQKDLLASLKLSFSNTDLTLVHGTLDNPQEFNYMTDSLVADATFGLLKTPVCFIGHTHVAGIFTKDSRKDIQYRENFSCSIEKGKKYIINVGSVGQPRDGNPRASFCIYDTNEGQVEIKRVDYDIKKARGKIVAAGLPEYLGQRLLLGR